MRKIEKKIISEITRLMESQEVRVKRIWKKVNESISVREKEDLNDNKVNRLNEALQIAHRTTSLMRDILNVAGYIDSKERGRPIDKSIKRLITILNDPSIMTLTRRFFAESATHDDIEVQLQSALKEVKDDDFPKVFGKLRPIILQIVGCIEKIFLNNRTSSVPENSTPLEPPFYIVMWDIHGSTQFRSRLPLTQIITQVNKSIKEVFGQRILDFNSQTTDDGNGFICYDFSDVLGLFNLLSQPYNIKANKFERFTTDPKGNKENNSINFG